MRRLEKKEDEPKYMQVYQYFKQQITSGEMKEGSRMPSTRGLAKSMEISRNTVESAYQQLCAEGYLLGKACSGYVVLPFDAGLYPTLDSTREKILFGEQKECGKDKDAHIKYNFLYEKIDLNDFPIHAWKKALNEVLNSNEMDCFRSYNDRKGERELRIEIMKYLYFSRGVRCRPEQIVLTSGTVAALSLICQLFAGELDSVALEEPCYHSARAVFKNHRMEITSIPVEEDGICVSCLKDTNAKLVYTTPSHQFPTGKVMGINKRLHLIQWAEENDAYLIEDDYDSELRYNSKPIPSMQSLDAKERVIYVNTFSKAFVPSLRMSFMVLPQPLLEKYHEKCAVYNCSVSWIEQKTMQIFIQSGGWSRHLRKICTLSKKKHDTLIYAIQKYMKKETVIHGNNAGLHILLEVHNGMKEKELLRRAETVGVRVYPVSIYWEHKENYKDNMVLIGYSSLSEEEIEEGIKLLHWAWFESII